MLRTTIETQESERYFNYYDAQSREDYGVAIYPYETLRFANEIGGDCRRSRSEDAETGSYRPCANVMPLVNERGQADAIQSLREDEIVDACELNFASHIHIFNKITLRVILTVIIDKYHIVSTIQGLLDTARSIIGISPKVWRQKNPCCYLILVLGAKISDE